MVDADELGHVGHFVPPDQQRVRNRSSPPRTRSSRRRGDRPRRAAAAGGRRHLGFVPVTSELGDVVELRRELGPIRERSRYRTVERDSLVGDEVGDDGAAQ